MPIYYSVQPMSVRMPPLAFEDEVFRSYRRRPVTVLARPQFTCAAPLIYRRFPAFEIVRRRPSIPSHYFHELYPRPRGAVSARLNPEYYAYLKKLRDVKQVQQHLLLKQRMQEELKETFQFVRNQLEQESPESESVQGNSLSTTLDYTTGAEVVVDSGVPASKTPTTTTTAASPAPEQTDEVSVEDVDEDDEREKSDIVYVDWPKAEVPTQQSKSASVDWSRELELLSVLGYHDQKVLLPLLEKHLGHPGTSDRSSLKKVIQELLLSSSSQ